MKKAIAVAMVTAVSLASAWAPMVNAADKEPRNEQKISLDQVPAAVKTTLEKEAKGGTIGDVTMETEKGKRIYEAEIIKNGKARYVNVSPEGKVLKRESAKRETREEAKPNR